MSTCAIKNKRLKLNWGAAAKRAAGRGWRSLPCTAPLGQASPAALRSLRRHLLRSLLYCRYLFSNILFSCLAQLKHSRRNVGTANGNLEPRCSSSPPSVTAAVFGGCRSLRAARCGSARSGSAGRARALPGGSVAQQGAAEGRPPAPGPAAAAALPLLSHRTVAPAVFLSLNSGTARMGLGLFHN